MITVKFKILTKKRWNKTEREKQLRSNVLILATLMACFTTELRQLPLFFAICNPFQWPQSPKKKKVGVNVNKKY